jgi:uncharacterized membrane protein
MKYKNFKTIKAVTAFFLAMIMAQAVVLSNYFLAIAAVLAAIAVIFVLRKKVEGVLADERDYAIAGKAARISLSIFSVVTAIATFVFMSLRNLNPVYEVIGSVLAYSVCSLLLLNGILFTFYEKRN